MANVLGIDLGTTNTSAAFAAQPGRATAVQIGPPTAPDIMRTAVYFGASGQLVVGDRAIRMADEDAKSRWFTTGQPPRLLTSFKALLGEPARGRTRWTMVHDPVELRSDTTTEGTIRIRGGPRYVLMTEARTSPACPPGFTMADVEKATEAVLRQVQESLTRSHGRIALDHVVVGVPIGFPDIAKERIIAAVHAVGLAERSKVRLVHEPVAVALAYGIRPREPKRLLVFDHGGGTLDTTVLDVEAGARRGEFRYSVVAQKGYDHAGSYYDRLLLSAILKHAGAAGKDALAFFGVADPMHITQPLVLETARQVKERLCERITTSVQGRREPSRRPVRFVHPFESDTISVEVSPELLHTALDRELAAVRQSLTELLADAEKVGQGHRRAPGGIDEVLLAGGSAQLPFVMDVIRDVCGQAVRVDARFAGSRTSTVGFPRALEFESLIDTLADTSWGVYDPSKRGIRTIVAAGTPIRETKPEVRRGTAGGFYIQPHTDRAKVALFARQYERWEPVALALISTGRLRTTSQIIVEISRATGRPILHALACDTGAAMRVAVSPGSEIPMLEMGNIIRFRQNLNLSNARTGVGCISRIDVIESGIPADVALGDMRPYRLLLHDAEGRTVQVVAESVDLEVYDLDIPRPGEMLDLLRPDERKFIRLAQIELRVFDTVSAPLDVANLLSRAEAAPAADVPPLATAKEPLEAPADPPKANSKREPSFLTRLLSALNARTQRPTTGTEGHQNEAKS